MAIDYSVQVSLTTQIILSHDDNQTTGVILEGDLGEKVSLIWLASPYLELREK